VAFAVAVALAFALAFLSSIPSNARNLLLAREARARSSERVSPEGPTLSTLKKAY
jgi:hypothetical protein